MVNIKRFMCNPLQENCYVVSDDTKECVIIDCGAFFPDEKSALTDYVRENSLKPVHLIATHGHLDHNFGNAYIFSEFGLKVEVCKEDDFLIEHLMKQAKELFGIDIENCEAEVGRWLKDGDTTIVLSGHGPQSTIADELMYNPYLRS